MYPGRGDSLTQMTYEIIQLQLLINAEHAADRLEGGGVRKVEPLLELNKIKKYGGKK